MLLALATLTTSGCERRRGPTRTSSGTSSVDRSGQLLEVVASQLAGLPESGIVDLTPEVPILDARSSTDGQDVLAKVTTSPDQPFLNRVVVPNRNAGFRRLGVQSGDMVRFYVRIASDIDAEYRTSSKGLSPQELQALLAEKYRQREEQGEITDPPTDVRIRIAQVIDDNTLLLEDPLNPMLLEGTLDLNAIFDPSQVPASPGARLEVWRVSNQRVGDLLVALNRYAFAGVPRLGWEPSPDNGGVEKIVEYLNQWLRQTKLESDWQPSPFIATLPEELRERPSLVPFISKEALERMSFSMPSEELRAVQGVGYEGRLLQEATFARDISRWASAGYPHAPDKVAVLFDWTVRNIQLLSDTDQPSDTRPLYRPWQNLVFGRGEVAGRVWVFAQLCRQLGVPVVVFTPELPAGESQAGRLICGAIVRDNIYLFDPYLGLPLPSAQGLKPATWAELRDQPDLLRRLDLDDEPYPLDFEKLAAAPVQVIAEPFSLTRRAHLLESRLTGDDLLVLSVDPAAVASQLKSMGFEQEPTLWAWPYEVLQAQVEQGPPKRAVAALEFQQFCYRPYLWRARMLHFRGRQPAEKGTLTKYDSSTDDHRDAGRDYTRPTVMATLNEIRDQEGDEVQRNWLAARINALYWVGLLKYDQGDHEIALDWLRRSSQMVEGKPLKWYSAAKYNEARALEALGKIDEAIALLEADDPHLAAGSRQRARLLKQKLQAEASAEPGQ
jgi:tetratricopeptide (TPR) repeat protein